jgi:hypothetical protein
LASEGVAAGTRTAAAEGVEADGDADAGVAGAGVAASAGVAGSVGADGGWGNTWLGQAVKLAARAAARANRRMEIQSSEVSQLCAPAASLCSALRAVY